MKDRSNLRIDPFTNVDVQLSPNLQLAPNTRIIVGLNQDPGLSFPNVVVSFERGNYNMNFRLGFFYKERIVLTLPVRVLIERGESDSRIHIFVTIDNEWREVEQIRYIERSPHASENISYYISYEEVPEEPIKQKDTTTYRIKVGFQELNLILDNDIIEFCKKELNDLKEQILGNAIIWACLNSKGRQIQTIEVSLTDREEQVLGIEYHFIGIGSEEPEFDRMTIRL